MSQSLKSRLLPPKPEGAVVNIGHRILQWNKFYIQLEKNIDALEAEAVPVYGYEDPKENTWTDWNTGAKIDEHSYGALLINVQTMERGVSVDEVVHALRDGANEAYNDHIRLQLANLAERIEKEGIKK